MNWDLMWFYRILMGFNWGLADSQSALIAVLWSPSYQRQGDMLTRGNIPVDELVQVGGLDNEIWIVTSYTWWTWFGDYIWTNPQPGSHWPAEWLWKQCGSDLWQLYCERDEPWDLGGTRLLDKTTWGWIISWRSSVFKLWVTWYLVRNGNHTQKWICIYIYV